MSPPGPCRIFGGGERVGVTTAAFANGSCAQALEYDDTHNESIVHMSSPAVAAALALAETRTISGQDLVLAIAVGNEISCRVGSVAPGQFHKRGFHPTGLFAPFGVDVPGGAPARTGRPPDGAGGGRLRQLRLGHSRMLGRRHAPEVPAPRLGRAERHRGGVPGARAHDRARAGARGTVRALRVSPAGRRTSRRFRSRDRRPRFDLGQPELVAQALPRRARHPPVHRRAASHPGRARRNAGRRRAHRRAGRGVHRADRVRARRREVRARHATRTDA